MRLVFYNSLINKKGILLENLASLNAGLYSIMMRQSKINGLLIVSPDGREEKGTRKGKERNSMCYGTEKKEEKEI